MGKCISIPLIAISIHHINGYPIPQNGQDEIKNMLPNTLKHLSKHFRKRQQPLSSPSAIDQINQKIFSRTLLMDTRPDEGYINYAHDVLQPVSDKLWSIAQQQTIEQLDKEIRIFFKEMDEIQTKFKIFYDQLQQLLIKKKRPSQIHEHIRQQLKLRYKEIQFYPFMTTFMELAIRHSVARTTLFRYLLTKYSEDDTTNDPTFYTLMHPLESVCKDIWQYFGKTHIISNKISLQIAIFVYKRLYHQASVNGLVPISSFGHPISFKHPETIFSIISPIKYLYAVKYDLLHLSKGFLDTCEHGRVVATRDNFAMYIQKLVESQHFASMDVSIEIETKYQLVLAILESYHDDLSLIVSGDAQIRRAIQIMLINYYTDNNKYIEHDSQMKNALRHRNIYDIIINLEFQQRLDVPFMSRRVLTEDNNDSGNIMYVPRTIVSSDIQSTIDNSPYLGEGYNISFTIRAFDRGIMKLIQQEEFLLIAFKTFYTTFNQQLISSPSFDPKMISFLQNSYKDLVFHPFMSTLVENIISSRNDHGPSYGPVPAFKLLDKLFPFANTFEREIDTKHRIMKGLQQASIEIMRNAYPIKYHVQEIAESVVASYPQFQIQLSLSSWYYQEFYAKAIEYDVLPQYPYHYELHSSSLYPNLLIKLNEKYELIKEYHIILYTENFFKSLNVKSVIKCVIWQHMRDFARVLMMTHYHQHYLQTTFKFLLTLLQSHHGRFEVIQHHDPYDQYLAFWQRMLIRYYQYHYIVWRQRGPQYQPDMSYVVQMGIAIQSRDAVNALLWNEYEFEGNRITQEYRDKVLRFYLYGELFPPPPED